MKNHNVAIVYDWATTKTGGAEKVLLALHDLYPSAPLFTLVHQPNVATWTKNWSVTTSWLNKFDWWRNYHRLTLPFIPLAIESLDLKQFDLVISVTSMGAKGIITQPHQTHICYLLTTPRFLLPQQKAGLPFWLQPIANYYQWWDKAAAHRPDFYIAISQLIANRLKNQYGVSAKQIIYPPVEIPTHQPDPIPKDGHWLTVGRLMAYKRFDLAMLACAKRKEKLVVVGSGPELKKLQNLAKKINEENQQDLITLIKTANQTQLAKFFRQAKGLIMPGIDDFGITGLEALAYGRPVVINSKSGVAELIADQQFGIHWHQDTNENTISSLATAMQACLQLPTNPKTMYMYVRQWQTDSFKKQFAAAAASLLAGNRKEMYVQK